MLQCVATHLSERLWWWEALGKRRAACPHCQCLPLWWGKAPAGGRQQDTTLLKIAV